MQTAAMAQGLPLTTVFAAISMEMKSFFNCSTKWALGDGGKISFWDHDWGLGVMRDCFQDLHTFSIDTDITLNQAVQALQNGIEILFHPTLSTTAQEELQQLCISLEGIQLQYGQSDTISWRQHAKGEFTVKSAYTAIKGGPTIASSISNLW